MSRTSCSSGKTANAWSATSRSRRMTSSRSREITFTEPDDLIRRIQCLPRLRPGEVIGWLARRETVRIPGRDVIQVQQSGPIQNRRWNLYSRFLLNPFQHFGKGARCIVHGARCTAHGARSMGQGARCKERGARSIVHGARCKEHGARSREHGAHCP